MIRKIEASERHFSDYGWLKTYWLFSFSDYYDPSNIQFGALRVFNDDVVAPGHGFPMHPHHEMEILTYVLSGELTHEDSMGNRGVIRAGDMQRMSAGTGLTHSEVNLGKEPCHLYQIWIYPDERGLKPSYAQHSFAGVDRRNKLLTLASGRGEPNIVHFHTDAVLSFADLDAGASVEQPADGSRRVFIYVTAGEIGIDGLHFKEKDQARIDPDGPIRIDAVRAASIVLIDVPSCRGWGYDKQTLSGERR